MLSRTLFSSLLILLVLSVAGTLAAPYNGDIMEFIQPDGTVIEAKVWGDEYYAHVESLDGYTLTFEKDSGWITYAEINSDGSELVSTGKRYLAEDIIAGKSANANIKRQGLKKGVKLKIERIREKALSKKKMLDRLDISGVKADADAGDGADADIQADGVVAPAPLLGEVKGLILLIQFPDESGTISRTEIDNYANQLGYTGYGNNGSVRDYYSDVSNGLLDYTNYVTEYYTAKQNKSYYTDPDIGYGTRARELIKEALVYLDSQGADFSLLSTNSSNRILAINAFYVGVSGNAWSEGLWPHKSSMNGAFSADGVSSGSYQITNIGSSLRLRTFCHENGHMIGGWPDLYDYGGESRGVGNFCLMAGGGNNSNPVPPNAYFRDLRGWENVTDITDELPGELFTINTNAYESLKYRNVNNSAESFMIEAKRKNGRNQYIPDEGLLIWHIDADGSNNNEQMTPSQHYRVSVEQADGNFQLENNNSSGGSGDLFHDGYRDIFNKNTTPDSNWWDGSESGFALWDISAVGDVMSFKVGLVSDVFVGQWLFDSNFQDSSGNMNHGVGNNFSGDFWVDSFDAGKGQSLNFDGADDYVDFGDVAGDAEVSVGMWIKPDKYANMMLASKLPTDASGKGWAVRLLDDGRMMFYIGSEGNIAGLESSGRAYSPGQWSHVLCTFGSQAAKIYVDGILSRQVDGINLGVDDKTVSLKVSVPTSFYPTEFYDGQIDELHVSNKVLGPTVITQLAAVSDNVYPGLEGYWRFDDMQNNSVNDVSGNGYDASIAGNSLEVDGVGGKGLELDGDGDYCSIPAMNLNSNTVSMTAWVKITEDQKDWAGIVFSRGGNTVAGLSVRSGSHELRYHWNGSASTYGWSSGIDLPLDRWVMVALVVSPTAATIAMYDDGELEYNTNVMAHAVEEFDGAITIGYDPTSSRYFKGSIDDVRIYSRTIDFDDIALLTDQGKAMLPVPANGKIDYPFENTTLSWQPALGMTGQHVYGGTDYQAVVEADINSAEHLFTLGAYDYTLQVDLASHMTFYWRIDGEKSGGDMVKGDVWSFTTGGDLIEPPTFNKSLIKQDPADIENDYAGSIADTAKLANNSPQSQLRYSVFSGPGWLVVGEDGALSGKPGLSDVGLNAFVVKASDDFDNYDTTLLNITVADFYTGHKGLVDFAGLAAQWLDADCELCEGADLNNDNDVDIDDLEIFMSNWMVK
ncbi:MAG: M6 family metalloprotease domain-containing protein [Phycisphaerae bacterium]|nr:M6 family metalloprotease domain-containing protein [Phycisphaerae bacterium]